MRSHRRDGVAYLINRSHTGRDEQRLAGFCSSVYQRNVNQLERRDLDGIDSKLQQELQGRNVEYRTDAEHPGPAGGVENGLVPIPRRVGVLVEFPQAPPVPKPTGILNEK